LYSKEKKVIFFGCLAALLGIVVSILKKQLCLVFGEKQTSPALLGSKEV
jgi:hypothetical protein